MVLAVTLLSHILAVHDIEGAVINSKIYEDTYMDFKADLDLAKSFIKRYT
jgi:hypothetical protein